MAKRKADAPKPKARSASDRKFIDRINRVAVTKEEVLEFVRETSELAPELRDYTGFSLTAIQLHPGNVDKVGALMFRMEALTRLIASPAMKGWTYPEALDGATWTSEPVFAATAVEPLIIDQEGQPAFEPESFSRRVLELAEVDEEA